MCHDCPHRVEAMGEEIVLVHGYTADKAHPCHNNLKQKCEGHLLQLRKIAAGELAVDDFRYQTYMRLMVNLEDTKSV